MNKSVLLVATAVALLVAIPSAQAGWPRCTYAPMSVDQ